MNHRAHAAESVREAPQNILEAPQNILYTEALTRQKKVPQI